MPNGGSTQDMIPPLAGKLIDFFLTEEKSDSARDSLERLERAAKRHGISGSRINPALICSRNFIAGNY
jgi:hypothetical protein